MRDSTSKGSSIRFAESPRSVEVVRTVKLALGIALLVAAAGAQTSTDWTIDTIAGHVGVRDVGDNASATDAFLYSPHGVAVDGVGNVYIADRWNHRIRKVDTSGAIITIAGDGTDGYGGDYSPATAAYLWEPYGVAVDGSGNVYIADTRNRRIRKVDAAGIINTVAGGGRYENSLDGDLATMVRLGNPRDVAVDGTGNIYIADTFNRRIIKVDSLRVLTTIAGTGEFGHGGDGGPANAAQISRPRGVAVDSTGNVYIADTDNNRIRKVDSSGIITTIAGRGDHQNAGFDGDGGPATAALLHSPRGIAVDGVGNVYFADTGNRRIRKVDSAGTITTIVGDGNRPGRKNSSFGGDGGPATAAQLSFPYGVAVDGLGNVYIADAGLNSRIRKVDAAGIITTIAGNGMEGYRGDGGPAVLAQLHYPSGVAADTAGNIYIADWGHNRVRKVDAAGTITAFAGDGVGELETPPHRIAEATFGHGGDGGPAVEAAVTGPEGVEVDGAGNVYIAANGRIRKVDAAGIITTIAGGGAIDDYQGGGDGNPATALELGRVSNVAVDGSGNLYIAEEGNDRIRKVGTAGTITTIAGGGTFGFGGFHGDGGPATEAHLDNPHDVAVDSKGNIYIADTRNNRIRKVDAAGTITTFAGDGTESYGGDGGLATQAQLCLPLSVAVDNSGNVYIADTWNHRIRMVNAAGIITTIAGDGARDYGGDGGPATSAQLSNPANVSLDSAGNLYIADTENHRIRVLRPPTGSVLTTVLNAAGFTPAVAPGSIASLFGERLALKTISAGSQLLSAPALGSVRIEIIDNTDEARAARMLFLSPGLINFLMPDEAEPGAALLRLTQKGEEAVELAFIIDMVAPGLFSANGTGEGIGVIAALRVGVDGVRSNPAVFRYDAEALRVIGVPLDLGDEGDQVFLTLYGTGIRGAGGVEMVQATIGGSEAPVVSAGAQSGWAGLDQVEIGPLPRSLAGAGEVNVVVTAAGVTSNTVTIVIE